MNMTAVIVPRLLSSLTAVLAAMCLLLSACSKGADPGASRAATSDAPSSGASGTKQGGPASTARKGGENDNNEGVTLTPEESEKLGVVTQPAQAIEYRPETLGYGVVLQHEVIAQAVADVQTAAAMERFSKASLERAMQLHGTPGAVSADLEQTAQQKAASDSAALMVTTQKLSSIWGMQPPWKDNIGDSRVQSLVRGNVQLVRVTFPLGTLPAVPEELHGGRVGMIRVEAPSTLRPVWSAPADANIPGRSVFALLPAGTLAEGERLEVWAPTGAPVSGVLIPPAAIVLSASKYWCYLERSPGNFIRVEVDTSRPVSGGYVITQGVKAGDKIAVTAVGHLLAKETGSGGEPD